MGARDKAAKALMDWFGNSVARHHQTGDPLLLYRGEHGVLPPGKTFQSRTPNSLSFGNLEAAETYATDPNNLNDIVQAARIAPGYLKIENPIINKGDPFLDLDHVAKALGPDQARRIAKKFDEDIQNTNRWYEHFSKNYPDVPTLLKAKPGAVDDLYFDAYRYLDDPREVNVLKRKGYDGAIYGGSGETAGTDEFRIFDPSQFRSKYKLFGAAPVMGTVAAQDQYEVPR